MANISLEEKRAMAVRAMVRRGHSADKAKEWLDEPNQTLHGRTPGQVIAAGGLDFVLEQIGTPPKPCYDC